jgi:peptidase E
MIYLIGGGIPWSQELNIHLYNLLKEMNSLLLIPTSIDELEKTMNFADRLMNNFKTIGITFKTIHIVGIDETPDDIKSDIQKSDVVFLMGGNPEKQIDWCKRMNIRDALINFKGILMGTSAGAHTLCSKAIITKGRGYPNSFSYDGLGVITGLNVHAHYNREDMEEDTELKNLVSNSIDSIYAIPEGCAIVINNDSAYYLGNKELTCYLKRDLPNDHMIPQITNVRYAYV